MNNCKTTNYTLIIVKSDFALTLFIRLSHLTLLVSPRCVFSSPNLLRSLKFERMVEVVMLLVNRLEMSHNNISMSLFLLFIHRLSKNKENYRKAVKFSMCIISSTKKVYL